MHIKDIEAYLSTINLEDYNDMYITPCKYLDVKLAVEALITPLKVNPGNKKMMCYYEHLMKIVNYIKTKEKLF